MGAKMLRSALYGLVIALAVAGLALAAGTAGSAHAAGTEVPNGGPIAAGMAQ